MAKLYILEEMKRWGLVKHKEHKALYPLFGRNLFFLVSWIRKTIEEETPFHFKKECLCVYMRLPEGPKRNKIWILVRVGEAECNREKV